MHTMQQPQGLAVRISQGARPYQEDNYGFLPLGEEPNQGLLLVLADGMGGQVAGALASETAIEHFISDMVVVTLKETARVIIIGFLALWASANGAADSGACADRLMAAVEEKHYPNQDNVTALVYEPRGASLPDVAGVSRMSPGKWKSFFPRPRPAAQGRKEKSGKWLRAADRK